MLNADAHLRSYQFFADAAWPGYPLINNTLLSSRSVAPAASAWAVLHLLGRTGLRDLALQARAGALRIAGGVADIPGLRVAAPPDSTLVCRRHRGPEGPDVRIVADEAKKLGWSLQVQPGRHGDRPTCTCRSQPASQPGPRRFSRSSAKPQRRRPAKGGRIPTHNWPQPPR